MTGFWRRLAGTPAPARERAHPVDAAFHLTLLRAPDAAERRERERARASGQPPHELAASLMASIEFRSVYDGLKGGTDLGRNPGLVEQGLAGLGSDTAFVERAYQCLLGREADAEGRAFYLDTLGRGATRLSVVRALVSSDEFDARYGRLCPQVGLVPRDVQLCELANPAKWDNPEWVALLRSLGIPPDKHSMHRKAYEYAQTLFGLRRLGHFDRATRVVSVGAGHESILYWLANQVGWVVATDLYDESWRAARAGEGDEEVLRRPDDFAPFPYDRRRLVFLKMDGRRLGLRDATFDVAYSLSSIEHFGGLDGAAAAIDEMARVVRPGGLVVVATEFLVAGPPHHEAFARDEIATLTGRPGLTLLETIDDRVASRYEMARVDLRTNPYQTPQMLVADGESVFTSVMLFLEKQATA